MSLELNSPLRKQMTRMKMSNVTKGTVPLVHTYLDSEYIKVGEENDFEASSSNYQQMLNDLTYRDDGELTQVHAKRKQYGADIVNLWVNVGGYCGLAWGACTNTICHGEYSFSVQQQSCTTDTIHLVMKRSYLRDTTRSGKRPRHTHFCLWLARSRRALSNNHGIWLCQSNLWKQGSAFFGSRCHVL